jgi:hypothetical protein
MKLKNLISKANKEEQEQNEKRRKLDVQNSHDMELYFDNKKTIPEVQKAKEEIRQRFEKIIRSTADRFDKILSTEETNRILDQIYEAKYKEMNKKFWNKPFLKPVYDKVINWIDDRKRTDKKGLKSSEQ